MCVCARVILISTSCDSILSISLLTESSGARVNVAYFVSDLFHFDRTIFVQLGAILYNFIMLNLGYACKWQEVIYLIPVRSFNPIMLIMFCLKSFD